ncbi:MAG: GSCFA domain-containing protein [Bacteroidia bacterium]|nr:GSCFA domain-containing protein [Bacteroidia bacterium]
MKFRTELAVPQGPFSLNYESQILAVGSCFADRMGLRLVENKFQAQVNPFGVIFNPLSLIRLLKAALSRDLTLGESLFENQGLWHSFDFHSEFSHPQREVVKQAIEDSLEVTGAFLRKAEVVILTLGTARVYRSRETQEIVANCHKVPQSQFEAELLRPEQIVQEIREFQAAWLQVQPAGKILLTVSPVRHVKDGLESNAVSKSILRYACQLAVDSLEGVAYFPAYELVLDDLRDYRFFKKDLIHPNDMAEDYVWDKFCRSYMTADTLAVMEAWQKVKAGLEHRPFHGGSEAHRAFLQDLLHKMEALQGRMDLGEEMAHLRGQL